MVNLKVVQNIGFHSTIPKRYNMWGKIRFFLVRLKKIPLTGNKESLDQMYSELRTSDRFDDPLAYPGFGLGENMIFPKYELKLYFLAEHNF